MQPAHSSGKANTTYKSRNIGSISDPSFFNLKENLHPKDIPRAFLLGLFTGLGSETTVGDNSHPNDRSNGIVFVWRGVFHLSALVY